MLNERKHIRKIVENVLRNYLIEKEAIKSGNKEIGKNNSKTGEEKNALQTLKDPKINKTELGRRVCPSNWKDSTIRSYMSKLGSNNENPRDPERSFLKKVDNAIAKKS